MPRVIETDHYVRFETASAVEETERGLEAALGRERLRVDVIRDDVVRFKVSRGGAFDETPTFAVCADLDAERPAFEVERGDGVVRLRTAALVGSRRLEPFRLDVHRPDGSPVAETARDEDGRYWPYATLNDAFVVRRRCRPEDPVYGRGEKPGRHNRRRRDFTLWNTDVLDPAETARFTVGLDPADPRADPTSVEFDPYYVSIPFFHHQDPETGAIGASFVDNGYRAHYEFSRPEEYRIHFEGGQYTEYVFAGPDIRDVLRAYTWLTGRAAPPPLWALAYHQCRWFRYTQESIEALAARHRAEDIPCDALWLDIEYMDGYRVFTWDRAAFPDVPAMLARLEEQGFRVVTIVDPGVKREPSYAIYDQAVERDVLCRTEGGDVYLGEVWPGDTAFPDFVTEEGRAWWGELNAEHVRSGIAGIWNDMNEPATGDIPPDPMRFGRGAHSHARFHNQYALLMAMATTSGLREALRDRRTFVLTRAGFAGIQRYAAHWMGDNQARWDHLWLSMPMAMGFGLSGQPFVGADVGGFQGESNAELFLRWMQYGTLTPFFRNHSEIGNVDQYAWTWGEAVTDLVRAAIRLRYRLLPYLYAAFLEAAETGAPVQRPLVFDHQHDPAVRDLDDEYLLGPDLLVAPVFVAGATARHVYLPDGGWYDWHTDELHAGRRWLLVQTPIEPIPIFARAGAVIPMWPEAPASTAGHHPRTIELHLFVPVEDGTHRSLLQEDDGETTAALGGARYRTTFVLERRGSRVTLRGDVEGDGYPEFAREAFRLVVHGAGAERRKEIANAGTGFAVELDV